MTDQARSVDDPTVAALRETLEALRALNRAIWLHDPSWAVRSAATGRAAEAIARADAFLREHDPEPTAT